MTDEHGIAAKFESWLAQHKAVPTRDDAFATGDIEIAAGFLVQQGREADARLTLEELAAMITIMAESIGRQLNLDGDVVGDLFRLDAGQSFDQLRTKPLTEWPLVVVERVILMMEAVKFAVTLLSSVDRGYAWFHRPNHVDFLQGRSALSHIVNEDGGLRQIRDYLRSEVWG